MSKSYLKTQSWVVAKWRHLWHLCPECNSDAPYRDTCPVCLCGDVPRYRWWARWTYFRNPPL